MERRILRGARGRCPREWSYLPAGGSRDVAPRMAWGCVQWARAAFAARREGRGGCQSSDTPHADRGRGWGLLCLVGDVMSRGLLR